MADRRDKTSNEPDDLSPEWTEYEEAWAVEVADFDSPIEATKFLMSRKKFFRSAEANGISKEMLTPFLPNKPGFEGRVLRAFESIMSATKHAAE